MVAVENLNSEAVEFDFHNFDFESFVSEVGKLTIAAEKKNLSFAAERFDMTVVVAYMDFGSDSAIEVFDNLVEVLLIFYFLPRKRFVKFPPVLPLDEFKF